MEKPVKILFVCTANRMRSRTAEEMYRGDTRFSVKSAGTSIFAQLIINEDLVEWADHIVVMERHHEEKIKRKFPRQKDKMRIHSLGIPDIYYFMDKTLMILIKERFERLYDSEIKGKT
jgi:protein-tyrosine phosphatase